VVHRGAVRDLLDIAVWLAPDRSGVSDLAAMLTGPGAVIDADSVHRRLAACLPGVLGVYRATFPEAELFGIGRHPLGALGTASDVRFGCRIETAAVL
jgi:hypothetical protein